MRRRLLAEGALAPLIRSLELSHSLAQIVDGDFVFTLLFDESIGVTRELKHLRFKLALLCVQVFDFLILLFIEHIKRQRLRHLITLFLDEVLAEPIDGFLSSFVHAGVEFLVRYLFEFASEHFCVHGRQVGVNTDSVAVLLR